MLRTRIIAPAATAALGLAAPFAASASTPPTPPADATMDPDGLVDAAVAGFGEFVASYGDTGGDEVTLADCPVLGAEELVSMVAPIADASELAPALVATLQVEGYEDPDDPEGSALVPVVSCDTEDAEEDGDIPSGGELAGFGIGVFDYANSPEALQGLVDFATGMETGTEREPSAETFGGTVYGACIPDDESDVEGFVGCYQFWISGTFSVGVYVLVAESGAADDVAALGDALVTGLPGLLQHLADGVPPVDIVADDDTDAPCGDDAEAPGCVPPPETT